MIKKAGLLIIGAMTLSACNGNLGSFFGPGNTNANATIPLPTRTTVTPVSIRSNLNQTTTPNDAPQTYQPQTNTSPTTESSPPTLSVEQQREQIRESMQADAASVPAAPTPTVRHHARQAPKLHSLPPLTHGQFNAHDGSQ